MYSDRAFYDKARKSWVNRDFGIFDNLFVYEREEEERGDAPADSWLVWNEVVYESFQAGYLKKLDWDLYCRLKDPVAKRLYRFLDKRFYRSETLTLDLQELAFNKVRMSSNYNTAQIKRALTKGIRELEAIWELRPMEDEERFRKLARGKWEIVFERKKKRKKLRTETQVLCPAASELQKRGVSEQVAAELAGAYPKDRVQQMIELFDWHTERGEARGAGFLVAGIKSETPYKLPAGFQSSEEKKAERAAAKRAEKNAQVREERKQSKLNAKEAARDREFRAFWSRLTEEQQVQFERDALARADRTKRDGYNRMKVVGGVIFEQYTRLILVDHYFRTHGSSRVSAV